MTIQHPEPFGSFTVTLYHAPASWLASPASLIPLRVQCLVSSVRVRGPKVRVDWAKLDSPVPKGRQSGFLKALKAAIAAHLDCEVSNILPDRVEWE